MIRNQTAITVFLKTEKPDAAVIGPGSGLVKIVEKPLYRICRNHFPGSCYMIIAMVNDPCQFRHCNRLMQLQQCVLNKDPILTAGKQCIHKKILLCYLCYQIIAKKLGKNFPKPDPIFYSCLLLFRFSLTPHKKHFFQIF
mgnify:CR=1 FL=1